MRILEKKFSGKITGDYIWVPVLVSIGSNVRGRRFKEGSALIEPYELSNFITSNHPDCLMRLRQWLDDLHLCFIKEINE